MIIEIIPIIIIAMIPIMVVLVEHQRDKEFDEWLKEVYGEDNLRK